MNTAIIAVAGAGKTQWLANTIAAELDASRTIALTYTRTNQLEDSLRIMSETPSTANAPVVLGWCGFLLNEIVKPYLPMRYPNIQIKGLAPGDPKSFMYLKGPRKYFSEEGWVYPSYLGKLALDVINASGRRVIARLERLYDKIYIDEGQDLRGNDLCVLEALLKSSIDIHIVLDPRQSTLSTASRDQKYKKKYDCAKIIELYRLWERAGLLEIEHRNETRRFTPQIALFSDLIFDEGLGFERTRSNVSPRGYHDGIFLVNRNDISSYSHKHQATALAISKSQDIEALESVNIGLSKGMTRDDVVIKASGPIEDLLAKGKRLSPSSACSFYVAVTRARYSVAIAVRNPEKIARAMRAPDSIWHDIPVELA